MSNIVSEQTSSATFDDYLSGLKLYGDAFSESEIADWYADEAEAYANLVGLSERTYAYYYHELNSYHGFSKIGSGRFENVLGMGSAYGDELRPILERIGKIMILDPSEAFKVSEIEDVPVAYSKPEISGKIPFADRTFDLITCFGTLHHIPNASYVVSEMGRVLHPGGYALIREPISSMGDWRKPRPGLTKRERGIPPNIMKNALQKAGLSIISSSPCMLSPLTTAIHRITGASYYNTPALVRMDAAASRLTQMNATYFRNRWWHKIAPGCMFWVAQKSK